MTNDNASQVGQATNHYPDDLGCASFTPITVAYYEEDIIDYEPHSGLTSKEWAKVEADNRSDTVEMEF